MLVKAKSKSKSKRLPAKAKGKAPIDVPVIIKLRGGLEHKSTLNRLKSGLTLAPDPIMYVETANTLWGGGKWTSADLRSVLIQMEAEGMSQRDALESLRTSSPPMPTLWTVRGWLSAFPDFDKAHKMAGKMRADMMVESATELVVDALDNPKADPRHVKNAVDQFRWQASKLDRETFGEHRQVELTQTPIQEMSDEALDQRIKLLMGNKDMKKFLADKGINVMEAEVVEGSEPEDA